MPPFGNPAVLLLPAPASSAQSGAGSISSAGTARAWHTRQIQCPGQANSGAKTDLDATHSHHTSSFVSNPTPFPLLNHSHAVALYWLHLFPGTRMLVNREISSHEQPCSFHPQWTNPLVPPRAWKTGGETQPLATDIFPKKAKSQSEAS